MIGCCTTLDNQAILKENGFNFIEIKANELNPILQKEKGIQVCAVNNLLPRNLNIFNGDINEIKKETEKAFILAVCHPSIEIITFGSGTCRKVDFNKSDWEKLWKEYLTYLSDLSYQYKIKVGIEPLVKEETNLVNTIEEGLNYINKYELNNLGITLDSYHFFKEDGNFDIIKHNIKKIFHFHIADDDRSFPKSISEQNRELLDVLKSSVYKGKVSIEIDWRKELNINPEIIKYLKNYGY